METNVVTKIIAAFLSLTFPIAAYTDYHYRPTLNTRVVLQPAINGPPDCTTSSEIHSHVNVRNTNIGQKDYVGDDPTAYPRVDPTCQFGLCVNVSQYPTDQIRKLLSSSQFMSSYFAASEEFITLDNRFNSDEMTLCETMVHTIYPEKANNTKQVERVIVNVEGHKQGIVFETCMNNGKCKFSNGFPTGYVSFCQQKYIHKKLMVLDSSQFVFDTFEVPSCCVCTVKRTD